MINGIVIAVGVVIVIAILVWLGLKIRPAAFQTYPERAPKMETVPLPKGLPAPVERYFRQMYGEEIPVIKSAVITGRGRIRFMGIFLPARFRFTHEAGQNYRHYIETTFYGIPIFKINEYYVNGKERMEVPTGVMENNPKLDQGGVLGMWAESIEWLPAILAIDPQVKWEPVDDVTAFMVVPFGNDHERFLLRFDPTSGKIKYWEVMRYMNGEGDKTLWINGTWFVEGSPWAVFNAEDVVYNVPVDVSVSAKGP
jgi:hypothetical protein